MAVIIKPFRTKWLREHNLMVVYDVYAVELIFNYSLCDVCAAQ